MAVRATVDAEYLLVHYLRLQADVVTFFSGTARIYTRAVPPSPVFPLVVVQRFGGTHRAAEKLDDAHLQIDVWADVDDRNNAFACMSVIRGALSHWLIVGAHSEGIVTGLEEITGPQWLPDPVKAYAKYIWTIHLYTHPTP